MSDTVLKIGDSVVQHGPANRRIYLMKLAADDLPTIHRQLDELAQKKDYDKIFAKIPATHEEEFLAAGYRVEARVPDFYQGREAGLFLGRYLSEERATEQRPEEVEQVYEAACAKFAKGVAAPADTDFELRVAQPDDTEAMAELYRTVFASYPFPIDDPAYLLETMEDNVVYYGIWRDDRLLALASAEIDFAAEHVEMTDFATHPDALGHGYAALLLDRMERDLRAGEIKTAYTIARAYSFGMNITFARLGYRFSGTLVNNTDIFGGLESMNVWYKPLQDGS